MLGNGILSASNVASFVFVTSNRRGRAAPTGHANRMLLMIDNYDSFTWNLVQYFGELGEDVRVIRNDDMTLDALRRLGPASIVVSPGPCTPNEAGVSLEVIEKLAGSVPILGVCLGHQAIGQAFGGKVVRAREIMHGKTSMIHHDGKGVFRGLPNPFEATRYHSLVVEESSLPECLEVSAWTVDRGGARDEIMGLRHRTLAVEGVQFHPESILTQHGHALLRNFLGGAREPNQDQDQKD
jgi:anthranilate synthase component 2